MNHDQPPSRRHRVFARARQLLFWLLAAAFVWLLANHVAELEQLGRSLQQGRWNWVLLALLLQLGYAIAFSRLYAEAFAVVGIRARVIHLLPLYFSSLFIGATTPTGGSGALALFVDDATRRGHPLGKATAAIMLAQASHLGAYCLVLLVGLPQLLLTRNVTAYELAMGGVMLLYVVVLSAMLVLGFFRPEWLWALLHRLQRAVNRVGGWFGEPALLEEEWAARQTGDFGTAAGEMRRNPGGVLNTALLALATHVVNLLTLAVLFVAFRIRPDFGWVVSGYTLTFLFTVISPTPYGIGIVEVLLPATYTSFGLPPAEATLITVAYRGLSFWLPLFLGFLLLRRLGLFRPATGEELPPPVWPAAVLTGLMGLLNILSVVAPALVLRVESLRNFAPLYVRQSGNMTALIAGLVLLTLAYGLAQRHRFAWLLVQIALIVSAASHLVREGAYAEGAVALLLFLYLISQRSQFE